MAHRNTHLGKEMDCLSATPLKYNTNVHTIMAHRIHILERKWTVSRLRHWNITQTSIQFNYGTQNTHLGKEMDRLSATPLKYNANIHTIMARRVHILARKWIVFLLRHWNITQTSTQSWHTEYTSWQENGSSLGFATEILCKRSHNHGTQNTHLGKEMDCLSATPLKYNANIHTIMAHRIHILAFKEMDRLSATPLKYYANVHTIMAHRIHILERKWIVSPLRHWNITQTSTQSWHVHRIHILARKWIVSQLRHCNTNIRNFRID